MATRAKLQTVEDDDDENGADEWRAPIGAAAALATQQEQQDENMVERLRAMLAQDVGSAGLKRVSLFRVDPKSPNMIWCANYDPAEFADGDMGMIREQYGPGLYEARVIGSQGIATKGRFQIAAVVGNPTAPGASRNDEATMMLTQMLQRMSEQNNAILQALTTRPDPQAEMLRNLEMLRMMRETFAPAAPSAPSAPAVDPVAQITSLLGAVRALKDASGEFQSEKPDSTSQLMGLAGSVVEMVKSNMPQRDTMQQPIMLPPSLAAPVTRPRLHQNSSDAAQTHADENAVSSPVTNPSPESEQPMSVEMMILRGTLKGLVALAEAKADPEKGGAYIFEKLPDELTQYLDLENSVEILCAFALKFGVDLSAHVDWLNSARTVALRLFAEDAALPDEE